MDVKDLRTESALNERNNDGSKYSQGSIALPCNRNKSYPDIGSNPLAKTEPAPVRPCAVIGPDRVVPPPNDAFLKKGQAEPWPSPDNLYRRTHEYPHKLISGNQNPTRNISPRQTFQEHMQRITVPPTYSALRHSDDANFSHVLERNVLPKNIKPNVPSEVKYCDVPYGINTTKETKNIKDNEMYMQSVNSVMTRTAPHGWPLAGVSVHAPRSYGAHELYQYPYPSCAGQRPAIIPLARSHRTLQEDPAYVYPDHYQDASAHYKAFPMMKDRYSQGRYDYISNYPSQFHPPPPLPPQKYDIPKPGQPHPYPLHPHLKYLDNRVPDHNIEGFQRPNQQHHYNVQFRNQVIHPTYASIPANSTQNKLHPYAPDGAIKTPSNKLPYDNNSKMFIEYENSRTKAYPVADNYYVNDMGRVHPVKNQMVMPNYSPIGMHAIPSQQYYRKEKALITKPIDYMPHFRNFDPTMNNNPMMRHAPQFSPNTLAISPSDSSTSNDTSLIHGTSQEDCGYVSQSSTASMRSVDSGMYRLPHEYYKRYDFRYGPNVRSSPTLSKSENSSNVNAKDSKQKDINVRQFLQMWNEDGVEEEHSVNNNSSEIVIQTGSSETSNFSKQLNNQDQLYVLGLVNVPSDELGKYEHIQKISKLPENIKGYNTLELLNQFEEAIESSNKPNFKSISKEYQISKINSPKQVVEVLPRPVSPLDVEAKISQSVIHKEVGCNFEIRPCSPKMLNVEVAAPAQNILGELMIEKVKNPLSNVVKSPKPIKHDENTNCHTIRIKENSFVINDNPSCKMIRSPFASNNMDSVKTNYSLQDLEINSGLCLASLPRLDNEIELNFPEVNQQFINANKKDDSTTSQCSTPNNLEEEFGLTDNKSVKKDIEKCENGILGDDSEKIYTKLSKYRKLKSNTPDNSEKYQVVRTDSVIIKNPENLKNIEDKLLETSLNTPMNLSSQPLICSDLPTKHCENSSKDLDVALDFSLNKSAIDLPIINTEKDELSRPLNTDLPYTSYNISTIDSIETCINKTHSDENIVFLSNNTNAKYRNTKPDESDLMNNDQCVKNFHDSKSEHTIEPVSTDTNTMILDNARDSVSESGNSPLASANIDVEYDNDEKNFNEVNTLHTRDKPYDTCKDTIITYKDNNDKGYNPAQEFVFSELTEMNSVNKQRVEVMQVDNPQNEVKKRSNNDKPNTCKFGTTQIENDFENDEITASLEKLFRDSDDDSAHINSDNDSMAKPVSLPIKVLSYHRNKELFSPWIQKLLTHSEGSCSKSERESKQRESLKSILNDDEEKSEEIIYNTFKVEHSQDMDYKYEKTILAHTDENETLILEETKKDSSSEALCTTGLESNKPLQQDDTVTDSVKNGTIGYSKNESPDEEKTSYEIMDVDYICSTSLEFNVNKSEGYLKEIKSEQASEFELASSLESSFKTSQSRKERELNLLVDSKSNTDTNPNFGVRTSRLYLNDSESKFNQDSISEPDTNLEFNVENSQSGPKEIDCIFNVPKSEPVILKCNSDLESSIRIVKKLNDNEINVCKAVNKINEDSNSLLQKKNNLVSINSTETQVSVQQSENFIKANIINANDDLKEEDTSSVIHKLDTNRNRSVDDENVSNSACDSTNGQNNKHDKCLTANVINNRVIETEHLDNNQITCGLENIIQDNFCKVSLEIDINDVTEPIPQDKNEGIFLIETVNERHIIDKGETSNTFERSQQNALTDDSHENQKGESEAKSLTNTIIPLPGRDMSKIINIETNEMIDILPPSVSNKIDLQSSSPNDSIRCTLFQTLENIRKEESLRKCMELDSYPISVSYAGYKPGAAVLPEENKLENKMASINTCNDVVSSYVENENCDTVQNTPNTISELRTERTNNKNEYLQRTGTVRTVLPAQASLNKTESNGIILSTSNTSDENTSDTLSDYHEDIAHTSHETSDLCSGEPAGAHNYQMNENESSCALEKTIAECTSDTQIDHPNQVNELLHEIVAVPSPSAACSSPIQDEINCVGEDVISHCILDTQQDVTDIVADIVNVCYQIPENDEMQVESNAINLENREITTQKSAQKRRSLKRSLSDSALNHLNNRDGDEKLLSEDSPFIWPSKRQRRYDIENSQQHIIDESLCNLIQNNRRNSVSAFCNEQNVSFCILIDNNCILTEESEDKICFAETSAQCLAEIDSSNENEEDNENEVISCSREQDSDISDAIVLNYESEKSIQESWLDDVACVETVVSDDIQDDVAIGDYMSPRDIEVLDYDESGIYSCDLSEHQDEVHFLNDESVCNIVAQNVEIYRSPGGQIEEDTILSNDNSVVSKEFGNVHYNIDEVLLNTEESNRQLSVMMSESESLENIISEPTTSKKSSPSPDYKKSTLLPETINLSIPENKENIFEENMSSNNYESYSNKISSVNGIEENEFCDEVAKSETSCLAIIEDVVHSCESSKDGIFSYSKPQNEEVCHSTPSSPEVSSTTFEEKSSSILLKITNYNGSRVSEINEVSHNKPRCKFTENKEYSNSYGIFPKRPLLTKAAQKYIPPLKESMCDLKVKLTLPQQRLLKLKQLKLSRSEIKQTAHSSNTSVVKTAKKPKPNFEDVLKSIDEVQIKKLKEKNKKAKNVIPKVVIKKNLNGSHYTSSSNKDSYNPDLTGRKWQPWVFLEKNHFIDQMAIRNKTKAIYNYRNNKYVLAEKFKKYKSVNNCNTKFVISQPKSGDPSKGQLKYTIRLKHTY